MHKRLIFTVALAVLAAGPAFAQVDPGRTKGTIRPTSQPGEVPQHSACATAAPGL